MKRTKSRREFLRLATASAGAAAGVAMLPASIRKALAIPATTTTGTIKDVQHVVIFMQENRSFDHYFGTLRGARGFGDPRPVSLPNGQTIWYQPPASAYTKRYKVRGLSRHAPYVLPFYMNPQNTTEHSPDTDHGWSSGHLSWNHGNHDHTSVLQFLETRFEIPEPNISAWRRAVCGDLTSAFDFSGSSAPSVLRFEVPKPIASLHRPYRVPAEQSMPEQEPGTRKTRALPYELSVHCREETASTMEKAWIDFANSGKAGAAFYVYNGAKPDGNPRRYTVSPEDTLSDYWLISEPQGSYDLTVHGPNGYLRQFRGNTEGPASHGKPEVQLRYDTVEGNVIVSLSNSGSAPCKMQAIDGYNGNVQHTYSVAPGASVEDRWLLTTSAGWYDISISWMESPAYLRRFAGHVETGRPSLSDPALLGG